MGFSLPQLPRMPSTHSAAIIFYGTYITLACAWLPLHASLPESPLLRPFVALVTVPWAFAVASSRIVLGHHTAPQVIVGCIYGFTFACAWFWAWTHGLNELGNIVERHVSAYIEL
jgi:dolichyldiphosphatase